MDNWKIATYYSREYGVILVDHIPVAGKDICTPVNPEGYPTNTLSNASIGKIVAERMTKAAQMPPMDKEKPSNYWYISGIKSCK